MFALEKIIELLVKNGINYIRYDHKPVITSEEADKIRPEYSLAQGSKALILKIRYKKDKKYYIMVVIPGDKRLDNKKLRKALKCKSFSFADEGEVKEITKGVLPGGIPPFGNIFGLKVYVDPSLSENEDIIFNAGDRSVSIAMNYKDWKNIVKPIIINVISD